MDATLYISFVLVSATLVIIPGPNVLVIVSTSIAHGKRRGLQTVAGTSLAMAIQLLAAALGTTWLVRQLSEGAYILKWLGVVYLVYLGLQHLRQSFSSRICPGTPSASSTFAKGFLVSLGNPKTILFFTAFLPQFVSSTGNYLHQVTLLSVTFLFIAVLLDSAYAILSAHLKILLEGCMLARIRHALSGVLYLVASAWLLATRR